MTGTGLVYGSLWDDSERGGCQDFIRPLKRAQQMPWHVRSTDACPTTATLSLVLSLGCVPLCGSRPSHRFKFAFPARVRRASREVVSDIAPRGGHFVARRVYSRRKNAAFSLPSSCVSVIPLDARGCCRNGQILRAKSLGTKNRKDL